MNTATFLLYVLFLMGVTIWGVEKVNKTYANKRNAYFVEAVMLIPVGVVVCAIDRFNPAVFGAGGALAFSGIFAASKFVMNLNPNEDQAEKKALTYSYFATAFSIVAVNVYYPDHAAYICAALSFLAAIPWVLATSKRVKLAAVGALSASLLGVLLSFIMPNLL